jgi:flagellar hook-associated protein 2
MSTITAPTYDPTSTATALAQKYTASMQERITNQTTLASATAKALSTMSSAISSFQTTLANVAGLGKSVLGTSATLSDTTIGSASAKANAASGTYSLFVQQLAVAGQVSYNSVTGGAAPGGTLKVNLRNETTGTATATFDVDLSAANADTDGVAGLSVRELAAAINGAPGNAGKVSAGVVTIGTQTRLVLTSGSTGEANTISLDAANVTDTTLKTALAPAARTVVTAAKDAIVLLGGTGGTPMQQASNTFTNIDGVTMTFTRAQAATESAITLKVGSDDNATVSNVQSFVDAYNKLKSAIDKLVDPGDAANGVGAGVFAHDAGVKALQSSLVSVLRSSGTSTLSLAAYGITASRDGTLALDTARLNKQLAVDPNGLKQLIGSATANTATSSGAAGSLNTYLNKWSNSTSGQIKARTEANTKLQSDLTKRQSDLDDSYNSAYARYLKQFTDLQTLQSTMNSNVSMFDALFGNDKSS